MNILRLFPDYDTLNFMYFHLPRTTAVLRPTKGNVARDKRAARKRRHIRARAPKS